MDASGKIYMLHLPGTLPQTRFTERAAEARRLEWVECSQSRGVDESRAHHPVEQGGA